jgi:hypothetical protein
VERDANRSRPKIFKFGKSQSKSPNRDNSFQSDTSRLTLQRKLKAGFEKDKISNIQQRDNGDKQDKIFKRDKHNITSGYIKLENKISKFLF